MEVLTTPPTPHIHSQHTHPAGNLKDLSPAEIEEISSMALLLEDALRAAKSAHLSCGQVLLPPTLLTTVASDVMRMADTEPCGLRGALIHIYWESDDNTHPQGANAKVLRRLSSTHSNSDSSLNSNDSFKDKAAAAALNGRKSIGRIEPLTAVATFELHLTLKEEAGPWYSRLPQIFRSWTKGRTLIVSPGYTLAKKKLYRR